MTAPSKDTIYIDIDDEITAIIDKVTVSPNKIVALVLPKRATTLQSIVNMKLLKRSADAANKNLVLVTAEPSLLPLAGAVGLHVAKTPQSKPEIPPGPQAASEETEQISAAEMDEADFDRSSNAATPIGSLAGVDTDEEQPIELDNEDPAPKTAAPAGAAANKAKKAGKQKKLKIPNFNKFRSRLGLAIVAGVLLIGFVIYALIAMPNASIAIATDTETIGTTVDVTFDATASEVDIDKVVVPSVVERLERSSSETVAASGERNDGERAEGSVVMDLCTSNPGDVQDIPAGTGVSTLGKNFITQEAANLTFSGSCGGGDFRFRSQSVEIVAQEGGTAYNVKNAKFTVAGSSATAEGSAKGGKDKIVKVVSQQDIDSASKKLESQADQSAKGELSRRLQDRNLFVIDKSFNSGEAQITSSVPVGSESAEVTVSSKTVYTMLGANKADLDTLVKGLVESEIDTERQAVLDTGVDAAVFELQNQQDEGARTLMSMDVTSIAGPELNEETIKDQVAGKKSAEAERIIGDYPGVTSVEVTYGPFWVSAIPSNTSKITITYEN
jgi:hypothetical protein